MQDRFKFKYFNKNNSMEEISLTNCYYTNLDYSKLMQSTGLRDKNGKLIYEGDIVQFYNDEFLQTMKIIWDNDELDFKAIRLKKNVECYEKDFLYLGYIKKEDSLEVIGNIYENPELLEVKNDRQD